MCRLSFRYFIPTWTSTGSWSTPFLSRFPLWSTSIVSSCIAASRRFCEGCTSTPSTSPTPPPTITSSTKRLSRRSEREKQITKPWVWTWIFSVKRAKRWAVCKEPHQRWFHCERHITPCSGIQTITPCMTKRRACPDTARLFRLIRIIWLQATAPVSRIKQPFSNTSAQDTDVWKQSRYIQNAAYHLFSIFCKKWTMSCFWKCCMFVSNKTGWSGI